jgi:hypothetical protein
VHIKFIGNRKEKRSLKKAIRRWRMLLNLTLKKEVEVKSKVFIWLREGLIRGLRR